MNCWKKFGNITAPRLPKRLLSAVVFLRRDDKSRVQKASGPLSEYATKARKEPVVVFKRGKPFAAVIPIRNADEETVSLSANRKFLAIVERSRSRTKKEGAISSKELRRWLGLKK